ncbi:helix-turn-helix domain-containing protein [Allocoleopsis sp.]|uniref:helix-turn-helix domain-containing protein n=1 Tax=Allocoleopsis sp. TaxID=3088169 RepID=UPI002FD1F8DB
MRSRIACICLCTHRGQPPGRQPTVYPALAVYGQVRLEDRLHSLLGLLKQEIGQPVAGGTRLSVRLTHEELATACCTTRVSITRLLKQLQQQKKLRVDSQHHLILKEWDS